MKKTQVALAALALVASTAALADGVTIYGSIDASIAQESGGKTHFDGTGNWLGSIFGFKGSEDLGGGTTVGFNLESGFNGGDGTISNGGVATTSGVFNRKANVFIGGEFGTLTGGIQLNPYIGAALGSMLNANESFYVPMLLLTAGNSGTGVSYGGTLQNAGFFVPNSVSYSLPAIGGLNVSVLKSSAGSGSTDSTNTVTAGSASASVGAINLAAGYMDRTSTNKNYTFTANTKFGDLGLGAGFFNVKNEGATSINTYHIAASYPLAANLTLSGNYAENGTSGGSMALTNIGLQYNLSKSSYFYGTASHAKNGAYTTYSGANGIGVAGTSNNGFAVGLVKAF